MLEERYEELRREWPDCMVEWAELTVTQKIFWSTLLAKLDIEERENKLVYETLGRVIVLNRDLLPKVEV